MEKLLIVLSRWLNNLEWTVQLDEYLRGERRSFDGAIDPKNLLAQLDYGTAFQRRVWEALCDIPYAQTRTYAQIAAAIGSPKAVRAVGNACNRNPLPLIIPCHRVVGSNGKLTDYAFGLELKRSLLKLEKDNLEIEQLGCKLD